MTHAFVMASMEYKKNGTNKEEGELTEDDEDDDDDDDDRHRKKIVRDSGSSHFRDRKGVSRHVSSEQSKSYDTGYKYGTRQKEKRRGTEMDYRYSSRNFSDASSKKHYRDYHDNSRQASASEVHTPSKFWANRQFRASSVRPLSNPKHAKMAAPRKTDSPQYQKYRGQESSSDHQNELEELEKEHRRIREQLRSLEEEAEEEEDMEEQNNGNNDNETSLLDVIGELESQSAASDAGEDQAAHFSGTGGEADVLNSILEAEKSDDEDIGLQELRRLALATSERHNRLMAKEPQETQPGIPSDDIVVIPDVEPDLPEIEIVNVEEEEDTPVKTVDAIVSAKTTEPAIMGLSAKTKGTEKSRKKSSSKMESQTGKNDKKQMAVKSKVTKLSPKKSRSKKRKKGVTKQVKALIRQHEELKLLVMDNPEQALEKLLKLAYERQGKKEPIATGTIKDLKRQRQIPVLSDKLAVQTFAQKSANKKNFLQEKSKEMKEEEKKSGQVQDNYDEVEMDIESETETEVKGPDFETVPLMELFYQPILPVSAHQNLDYQSSLPVSGAILTSQHLASVSFEATLHPPIPPPSPPHIPPPPPLPPELEPSGTEAQKLLSEDIIPGNKIIEDKDDDRIYYSENRNPSYDLHSLLFDHGVKTVLLNHDQKESLQCFVKIPTFDNCMSRQTEVINAGINPLDSKRVDKSNYEPGGSFDNIARQLRLIRQSQEKSTPPEPHDISLGRITNTIPSTPSRRFTFDDSDMSPSLCTRPLVDYSLDSESQMGSDSGMDHYSPLNKKTAARPFSKESEGTPGPHKENCSPLGYFHSNKFDKLPAQSLYDFPSEIDNYVDPSLRRRKHLAKNSSFYPAGKKNESIKEASPTPPRRIYLLKQNSTASGSGAVLSPVPHRRPLLRDRPHSSDRSSDDFPRERFKDKPYSLHQQSPSGELPRDCFRNRSFNSCQQSPLDDQPRELFRDGPYGSHQHSPLGDFLVEHFRDRSNTPQQLSLSCDLPGESFKGRACGTRQLSPSDDLPGKRFRDRSYISRQHSPSSDLRSESGRSYISFQQSPSGDLQGERFTDRSCISQQHHLSDDLPRRHIKARSYNWRQLSPSSDLHEVNFSDWSSCDSPLPVSVKRRHEDTIRKSFSPQDNSYRSRSSSYEKCSAYQPELLPSKRQKRHSPPPYTPTSIKHSSSKTSNVSSSHHRSDSEEEDPLALRMMLLADVIEKRKVEKKDILNEDAIAPSTMSSCQEIVLPESSETSVLTCHEKDTALEIHNQGLSSIQEINEDDEDEEDIRPPPVIYRNKKHVNKIPSLVELCRTKLSRDSGHEYELVHCLLKFCEADNTIAKCVSAEENGLSKADLDTLLTFVIKAHAPERVLQPTGSESENRHVELRNRHLAEESTYAGSTVTSQSVLPSEVHTDSKVNESSYPLEVDSHPAYTKDTFNHINDAHINSLNSSLCKFGHHISIPDTNRSEAFKPMQDGNYAVSSPVAESEKSKFSIISEEPVVLDDMEVTKPASDLAFSQPCKAILSSEASSISPDLAKRLKPPVLITFREEKMKIPSVAKRKKKRSKSQQLSCEEYMEPASLIVLTGSGGMSISELGPSPDIDSGTHKSSQTSQKNYQKKSSVINICAAPTPHANSNSLSASVKPLNKAAPAKSSMAKVPEPMAQLPSQNQRLVVSDPPKPNSLSDYQSLSMNSSQQYITSVTAGPKKYSNAHVLPVHPKVLVPVNASSDSDNESSEENNGQISAVSARTLPRAEGQDSMFNKQGILSEVGGDSSQLLKEHEELLSSYEQTIQKDQKTTKLLVKKVVKFQKVEEEEQKKKKLLHTQLQELFLKMKTTDKFISLLREEREQAEKQLKKITEGLVGKKKTYAKKLKSVTSLGIRLLGPAYEPRISKMAGANSPQESVCNGSQNLTRAQRITQEKLKLIEKEKLISEKLKKLKEAKAEKDIGKPVQDEPLPDMTRSPRSVWKSQDVIRIDNDAKPDTTVQQRRRSMLEMNPSTTPNIPMTPRRLSTTSNAEKENLSEPSVPELKPEDKDSSNDLNSIFKMPKGMQLSNFCKLQREKTQNYLKGPHPSSIIGIWTFPNLRGIQTSTSFIRLQSDDEKSRHVQDDTMSFHNISPAYSSPLLMFRSYRFNSYFRTKESLSLQSTTYSHKINPNSIICPYDLQGTCNDDSCQQLHPMDYKLSDRELLEDIVSYCPKLAGAPSGASPEELKKCIGTYVENFMSKHKGKMTTDNLCLWLSSAVNEKSGKRHPHRVNLTPRVWKPQPKDEMGLSLDLDQKLTSHGVEAINTDRKATDNDTIINEEGMRYFATDINELLSLEAAIMEDQSNTSLWQKLASKKLSDANKSPKECLDQALNVLARGLEANRNDCGLWLSYLMLYQKHPEVKDFPEFCQTALEYAPSYELWFLYLNSLSTYSEKDEACSQCLEFLYNSSKVNNKSSESDMTETARGSKAEFVDNTRGSNSYFASKMSTETEILSDRQNMPGENEHNMADLPVNLEEHRDRNHGTGEASACDSDLVKTKVNGYNPESEKTETCALNTIPQTTGTNGLDSNPEIIEASGCDSEFQKSKMNGCNSEPQRTEVNGYDSEPQRTEMNGCDSEPEINYENCSHLKKLSHQTLEMILYRTSINLQTGRNKTAVHFLQMVLGIKKTTSFIQNLSSLLTSADQIVLWLTYIYVLVWQQLPPNFYSAANQNPGKIMTKDDIALPWTASMTLMVGLDTLIKLHDKAARVWHASKKDPETTSHYVTLTRSHVALLVSQSRYQEAVAKCRSALKDKTIVDLWLTLADLHASHHDREAVKNVFREALTENRYSAKLQFYQNLFLYQQGETELALWNLEQFAISHFDTELETLHMCSSSLLYSQLLKQDEAFSLRMAQVKDEVSGSLHRNIHMWLCYSLLMELKGNANDTVEILERSLTHAQTPDDLICVWQSYISYLVRSGTHKDIRQMIVRSIISIPTKYPIPFSSATSMWLDYRRSNMLVEAWLAALAPEDKRNLMEMGLNIMPNNIQFLLRAIELCLEMNETRMCYSWCRFVAAQADKTANLAFWKMAIALAQLEGTPREVEQMLIGCVETMPLAVSGWKDFLLFEVSRENQAAIQKLLTYCQKLGLNIHEFVATLSAT